MDLEIPDRPAGTWTKTTFSRLAKPQQTCIFWQRGRCNRKPCNFLHVEEPGKGIGANNGFAPKRSLHMQKDTQAIVTDDSQPKVPDVTFLAQLVGHEKAVQGIVLPKNSDKLYSGGQDETVRIWDCKTGQCINAIKLGAEIGCLLSEGPWIFVGIPNVVKVWNTVTSTELNLDGPKGPVHTLVVGNGLLLAGISDGNILTWKFIPASNSFEPAASLSGHTMPVVTLVSGVDRLYSGSMDHTIRVWDLATFQCLQTLEGHTSAVMSLLLWEQFLLSSSLDNTIKVWGAMSSGLLKVNYTHNEEHGVLALCGMHDEQAKPVLICSRNDKCPPL